MPRAPNAVLAIVALAACGGEAVGPPPAVIHPTDASLVAPPVAFAAAQVASKSKTAGLDDALDRVIPTLGVSGLRDPLSALRDDLKLTKSTARAALLTAAYGALDRFQKNASDAQQADLGAIRLVLDAARVDDGK
jgi:hypothetical protein